VHPTQNPPFHFSLHHTTPPLNTQRDLSDLQTHARQTCAALCSLFKRKMDSHAHAPARPKLKFAIRCLSDVRPGFTPVRKGGQREREGCDVTIPSTVAIHTYSQHSTPSTHCATPQDNVVLARSKIQIHYHTPAYHFSNSEGESQYTDIQFGHRERRHYFRKCTAFYISTYSTTDSQL
jgi:hypothetical protein